MNKKTILKFNSNSSIRPAAWLALAILAVGAFGNSVQAAIWLDEGFTSYNSANIPILDTTTSPNLINAGSFGLYTTVINDGGNVARYNKTTTANGSQVMFGFSPNTGTIAPRTSGYVSFKVKQNVNVAVGTTLTLDVGIGNATAATTTSSSGNRLIGLSFKQTGTSAGTVTVTKADGTANSTANSNVAYTGSTSFSTVRIWFNDSDTATMPYTDPSGNSQTLAVNSFVVYIGSTLITSSASGTALAAAATGASLNFGKIGFSTSSNTAIDFSIDDVYAADTAPSAVATPTVTSSTATAQAGYPYSYTITSSGLSGTITYSTTSTSILISLGLTLNSSTGVISGTIPVGAPTAVLNTINFTATGTGGTPSGTLGLTITTAPSSAPTFTSSAVTPPAGKVNQAYSYLITSNLITTTPSSTPTLYAIDPAVPLPAGLALNAATGAITGMPTVAGTTTVTYTATNPFGQSGAQTLTITIDPAPIYTWNNTGTAYTSAGSWTNNSGFPSTTNDATVFGNVGSSTFTNVIVGTAQTNGGVTFNPNAYAYNWTGSDITVASAGGIMNSAAAIQTFGNKVINSGGDTIWSTVLGGSLVFNGGIDLTTSASSFSRTLTFAGAGNVTVNSVIADGGTATAGGVTISNTVNATLLGANTYRGTTKVAGGTLNLSGTSASSGYILAGASSTVVLKVNAINALNSSATLLGASSSATTGTLEFATAGNYTLNQYTGQNMGFSNSSGSASTLTFTNAINTLGTTTTGKTFANKSTDLTIIFKGDVDISGTTTASNTISTIGPVVISNRVFSTSTGVILRGLYKDETNTLTMYGVNSYNGTTTVARGTLNIPTGGSLTGCGTTIVASTSSSTTGWASLNLAGAAGVVQVGNNGYVRGYTSGSTTTLGTITSLQVQSAGTVEVPVGSTWTTVGTIEFLTGSKVSVTGTPVSGTIYTLMTATAPITAVTPPTLVSTASTAGWGLRVTGNSLYLEEVGIITIGGVASDTYSTDNKITGSNPMTKRGTGTLILNAPNDYTGGTIVEAGTLQIGNPYALGSSTTAGPVTLKGGTLKSTVDLDLARSTFTTPLPLVGDGNTAYQDTYGALSLLKYTGNNTTISGPVTLDVNSGTTMTMVTLVGNSDANSLVTKIGAGTVKLLGGSTKVSGTALATNGNGSTVLGGWRIQEGTVWFSPSSNNGGGNGPITLAGGNAKFTKLQNSNGTYTGFEVPSDLRVESNGLLQYDPDASTLFGQNTLGFNNLNIGSNTLEVATATSPIVGQSLPRVNFKSGILTGSATFNNPTTLDLALQAISGTGGFTKIGLGTLYMSDQPNQAAAFATLTSAMTLESINVEYAGSGYTAAPAVTLVGGGATTQATAQATIDSKGRVTSIAVLTAGVGYTSLPRVVIAAPPTVATENSYAGPTTVQAGKLNLNGSYASSVTVKSGAALQLDWLAPAEARCSIDQVSSKLTDYNSTAANAYVKDLYLTKSVRGYTPGATLNLTIEAPRKTDGTTLVPGGAAATATATVNSQGVISALSIVTGGSGYVISPRVTIPAPTEPTAVATTTGSITFESGARLALNIASPTRASYTLVTAAGGINGDPVLETSIPGYALTKSSDGKSLLLEQNDTTKPLITLNGASTVNVAYGASYIDLGARVTDNKDAERSINGTGTVNTMVSGIYTMTFNATDAAGNNADTVTRTVVVGEAPVTDGYALYLSSNNLPAGTAFNAKVNGVTAGLVYAFGSANGSPRNNGVTAVPVMSGNQLTYTFEVKDDSVLTVNYQTSSNLVDWTAAQAVSAATGSSPAGFVKKQVQVTGSGKMFVRISVTHP